MTSSTWSQRSSDRKREWPTLQIWRGLPLWIRWRCGSDCPGNCGNLMKIDRKNNVNPLILHNSQILTRCTLKTPRMWQCFLNCNNCLHNNWCYWREFVWNKTVKQSVLYTIFSSCQSSYNVLRLPFYSDMIRTLYFYTGAFFKPNLWLFCHIITTF